MFAEFKKRQLEECLFEAASFLIDSSSTNPAELDAVNGMLSLNHEPGQQPKKPGTLTVSIVASKAKFSGNLSSTYLAWLLRKQKDTTRKLQLRNSLELDLSDT